MIGTDGSVMLVAAMKLIMKILFSREDWRRSLEIIDNAVPENK